MWDWLPGRLVRLKTVNVDGVPLRLDVYPNGNIVDKIACFKVKLNWTRGFFFVFPPVG